MTTTRDDDDDDDVDSGYDSVLEGSCSFNNLPHLNNKLVRIFVSSTFTGL